LGSNFFKDAIARSAYAHRRRVEESETIVVGVNKFTTEKAGIPQVLKVDPALEQRQIEDLQKVKADRNVQAVVGSLQRLKTAAEDGTNLVGPVVEAVQQYVTVGEISDVFRQVWGEYQERL
jgi:methylmalonyl-CoA mutase N-terminal domain/subunit